MNFLDEKKFAFAVNLWFAVPDNETRLASRVQHFMRKPHGTLRRVYNTSGENPSGLASLYTLDVR